MKCRSVINDWIVLFSFQKKEYVTVRYGTIPWYSKYFLSWFYSFSSLSPSLSLSIYCIVFLDVFFFPEVKWKDISIRMIRFCRDTNLPQALSNVSRIRTIQGTAQYVPVTGRFFTIHCYFLQKRFIESAPYKI